MNHATALQDGADDTAATRAGVGPGAIDPARWALLSPWLDQLIDADNTERDNLLARAALQQPALADALRALLQRLDAQADATFMQQPARHAGSELAPVQPAGRRVGAYVVQRLLGQGGMGSVWLAQRVDGRYDGQVAIKFLHGGPFGRGDARRFAREGHILARLDHPHIARLLDAGMLDAADDGPARADAQPYLVLEYVEGLPIDAFVQTRALDVRATVALCMDVLAAVSHAHERLILHRDLKPSNIFVTHQGHVKLLDFGIAKLVSDALQPDSGAPPTQLTRQAGRAYTLRYAAPEQVNGSDGNGIDSNGTPGAAGATAATTATTATDVYALGVLLHLLLTGGLHPTSANDGDPPLAQLQALVHTTPRRVSDAVARRGRPGDKRLARALQGDLDTIMGKCLKKASAERYRNAAELADDLQRHLRHQPIAARPDSTGYRMARFVRRNPWGVAAATSVALALGGGTALALLSAREARLQRALAQARSTQAEGLVQFMLHDLRGRLEPVGRLDVLDEVGTKVLAYYAQQDTRTLDDDALGQRARALILVARVAEGRGQLTEAERGMEQAVASTSELLRRAPDNVARMLDLASGLSALGAVQIQRGATANAEVTWLRLLANNVKAHALDPTTAAYPEVVAAQVNLALFYRDLGRSGEARALLQQALPKAVQTAEAGTTADGWLDVANMRGQLADLAFWQGSLSESLAAAASALQALTRAPDASVHRRVEEFRGFNLSRTGRAQLAAGQLDAAAASFAAAVQASAAMTQLDPDNLGYLASNVRVRLHLTETLGWAGKTGPALGLLHKLAADVQRLAARADAPLDRRFSLPGQLLVRRAQLQPRDPQLTADMQAYVERVATERAKLVADQRRYVARVQLELAQRLDAAGRTADAQALRRDTLALLDQRDADDTVVARLMKAQLHWQLGDAARASSLVAELDRTEYRHPVYAAFKRTMVQASQRP